MNIVKLKRDVFTNCLIALCCFYLNFIGESKAPTDVAINTIIDSFNGNIDSFVAKLKTRKDVEIPSIHTTQFNNRIKNTGEKKVNLQRTQFAINLLKAIQKYQEGVCALKWDEFNNKIGNLEFLRKKIIKNKAYVNYIIANYLDKVITTNLLKRLILSQDKYDLVESLSEKNRKNKLFMNDILKAIEKEYDKKIFDFEKFNKLSEYQQLNVVGEKLETLLNEFDFGDTAAPRPVEWIKNLNAFEFFFALSVNQPTKYILNGFIALKKKGIKLPEQEEEFNLIVEKSIPKMLNKKTEWRYQGYSPADFYLWYTLIKNDNLGDVLTVE